MSIHLSEATYLEPSLHHHCTIKARDGSTPVIEYIIATCRNGLPLFKGSTALQVQRLVPHVKVTIFSDLVSPDTTADGAAGIFGLYLMGSTPVCDQVRTVVIQGPPDQ